jgi:hypothetical protein
VRTSVFEFADKRIEVNRKVIRDMDVVWWVK